jgi:hypothetical protein
MTWKKEILDGVACVTDSDAPGVPVTDLAGDGGDIVALNASKLRDLWVLTQGGSTREDVLQFGGTYEGGALDSDNNYSMWFDPFRAAFFAGRLAADYTDPDRFGQYSGQIGWDIGGFDDVDRAYDSEDNDSIKGSFAAGYSSRYLAPYTITLGQHIHNCSAHGVLYGERLYAGPTRYAFTAGQYDETLKQVTISGGYAAINAAYSAGDRMLIAGDETNATSDLKAWGWRLISTIADSGGDAVITHSGIAWGGGDDASAATGFVGFVAAGDYGTGRPNAVLVGKNIYVEGSVANVTAIGADIQAAAAEQFLLGTGLEGRSTDDGAIIQGKDQESFTQYGFTRGSYRLLTDGQSGGHELYLGERTTDGEIHQLRLDGAGGSATFTLKHRQNVYLRIAVVARQYDVNASAVADTVLAAYTYETCCFLFNETAGQGGGFSHSGALVTDGSQRDMIVAYEADSNWACGFKRNGTNIELNVQTAMLADATIRSRGTGTAAAWFTQVNQITGVTDSNSDEGKLYYRIKDIGGSQYRVDLYPSSADRTADTNRVGYSEDETDTGGPNGFTVNPDNASGLGGSQILNTALFDLGDLPADAEFQFFPKVAWQARVDATDITLPAFS